MLIGSHQKLRNYDLCITVDGKQLSRVSSVRYLGIHIDENLSWHQHTANVTQRVYSRIHCLNCLHPLPADLLAKLYRVFVLPILDYCDIVYGHHHLCNISNIWRGFIQSSIVLVSCSQTAFFRFYLCRWKKGSGYLSIYFCVVK